MTELFSIKYCWLIPLLPLIGAIVSGFFGAKWLKGSSHWPIWLGVGASAVMSIALLFGMLGLEKHEAPEGASTAAHGNTEHGVKMDTRSTPERYPSAPRQLFTWLEAGNKG